MSLLPGAWDDAPRQLSKSSANLSRRPLATSSEYTSLEVDLESSEYFADENGRAGDELELSSHHDHHELEIQPAAREGREYPGPHRGLEAGRAGGGLFGERNVFGQVELDRDSPDIQSTPGPRYPRGAESVPWSARARRTVPLLSRSTRSLTTVLGSTPHAGRFATSPGSCARSGP